MLFLNTSVMILLKMLCHERNESNGRFQFYQGSKIVRGNYDSEQLHAEVTLAKMPSPNVPVMRRLLEMNFNLYYSRYALDSERLCMRFDSDIETANPNKLYYGLKELVTKGDKQDDLLVQDFTALQTIDTDHIIEIPAEEKEIKFGGCKNGSMIQFHILKLLTQINFPEV